MKTQRSFEQRLKISSVLRLATVRLGLLLPFLLVLSCSTAPKNFKSIRAGSWEARALVKDKRSSKKYIVNIDFVAEKPQFLRMEVTSTVGHHLASFAMNEKSLSWIIPRDKKWFKGMVNAENVRPVLGHAIDPRLIHNILFDEPIPQKDWSCTADSDGVVMDCQGRGDMKIVWSDREGRKRNVLIQHPSYEIQLQFHSFEKAESLDPALFNIGKPKS